MSEELNTQTNEPIVSTPASGSTTLSTKDLLIPVSIVVAGLFVGVGLYFGTGPETQVPSQLIAGQGQPPAQPAIVDNTGKVSPVTEEDHIKGSIDAQVKIVEFSDFDCPFCNRFHDVMNSIVAKYPADQVAWVYRQFPLEQLHPQAPAVALASECVAELGGNDAFWYFADGYLESKGSGVNIPHAELIPQMVLKSGVDQTAFTECFESERHITKVQDDINQAVETGGRGTPWSIIIGPSGKTYPINGALPQQAVESLIQVALDEA